ncbi:MAG: TrkA C-terminal domain-containing protein, partial [Planctomycetota bacterium]
KFHNSEAEVLELVADETSKIVGKPLREIALPQGAILGAIVREGVMQIPTGSTMINPGERVVVFTLPHAIEKVQSFFIPKKG